ncbi:hypothetical protein HJC99_02140 [Candidatus Saccharibacteria bacterium]|nr:hypothetical protein [Candidatus Saccharibacteria bacterium]
MTKPDPLDDYPLPYQEFYAEIPGSTDYLNDIDPSIFDEHDLQAEMSRGLSEEQVSEIARDSLDASRIIPQAESSDPQLFKLTSDDASSDTSKTN